MIANSFSSDLYNKYDLLLPSKFDGGYLIIILYEKIKTSEIENYFSIKEINEILKDISINFKQDSVRQWSSIKDNLFHYFLRSHPDEPWKYYLTDYAKSVVDLMISKLENPYKNQPLKKNVERSFTIRHNEISTIEELERKFGRIFIQGSKKIVTDHLESLEDELRLAYKELNEILHQDEQSATALVKAFTVVFKKFGEKAEDITESMLSKDRFITALQNVVHQFYTKTEDAAISKNEGVQKAVQNWEKAQEIYIDIRDFFNSVDLKISIIRRQISHASEKLTELHEQFSARAYLRLQIKKLYGLLLESAEYTEDSIKLTNNFPLKRIVYERTRILYPRYLEFDMQIPNIITNIQADKVYERNERGKIEKEINQQQIINKWVDQAKLLLEQKHQISVDELMNLIITKEKDLSIAYQVVSKMIAYVSETTHILIDVEQKIISLPKQNIASWKVKIMK